LGLGNIIPIAFDDTKAHSKLGNWSRRATRKNRLLHQHRRCRGSAPQQGIAHPWNLALGQGEGQGQRRAWDAGAKPLGLGSAGLTTMALSVPRANSDVLDENGEAKIVIEMAKAPKRED
jgi:hypothetical protein